jgi:hypothetical protein
MQGVLKKVEEVSLNVLFELGDVVERKESTIANGVMVGIYHHMISLVKWIKETKKMATKESDREIGLGCLVMIMVFPIIIILKGFVLSRLWVWFMVPLGLPPIGLWHANGISAVFTMLIGYIERDKDEEGIGEKAIRTVTVGIGAPLLIWLLGWIFYCCM